MCYTSNILFMSRKMYSLPFVIHKNYNFYVLKVVNMMKFKSTLLFLPVLSVTMTGCGQILDYKENLSKYVFTMDYHDDFNILQLTDIHWDINSSSYDSKVYMDKVLAESDRYIKEKQGNAAKIDLVELTGDMFMLANTFHVDSFLRYFEKKSDQYGFQYAVIWGNHDRHGLYSPTWIANRFAKAKNCIYYEPNDNLNGRSNFMINLVEGNAVRWQIANLDSGASFSESSFSPFKDYDYIRKDQTEWWLLEHNDVGDNVPAIAYYHIPQDENQKMFDERATHKNKFFKLEVFADNGNEEYASDFIDVAIKHNLKGAFMGHAHNVDWTVEMEDPDTHNKLVLGLGVKTGPELYYAHIDVNTTDPFMREGLDSLTPAITENFDLIGATLVTLTDTLGSFDLEHLYLNERKGTDDFVRWVKW